MAGTYNPHANKYNEKIITINFDRVKYWLVVGAQPTVCNCGFVCFPPFSCTPTLFRPRN